MTWHGKNPLVPLTEKIYETGKKVEKDVMTLYETVIERANGLKKWFVTLNPDKCYKVLNLEIKV